MRKNKKVIMTFLLLLMVLMIPMSASAKFTLKKKGVTYPKTLKYGSCFSVRGTLTSNMTMKKVVVTIYKGNTCLQRYTATPYSKTFNLANADASMVFDKLPANTYYYRISAYNMSGKKKRALNKKFTVKGDGAIKITNPLPSKDITIRKGTGYAIGGKITSTYGIKSITAKIINSSGKTVYVKTVNPSTKTYSLTTNRTIDNAMRFDALAAGVYKFQVSVTDVHGSTGLVINRKVTVSGTTSTSSTGSAATSGGSYTASGTNAIPAGYIARTGRPAHTNKYYYSPNYNIYYKYNSLAPTGNVYYGNSYVLGNCTWYACGRAMEIVARAGGDVGKVQAIFGGDPVGIYQSNVKLNKFKYGSTPKVGSLVVFNYGGNSGDAHIAVVEKIVNGVPYVSESGYTVSTTKPNATKSNIVFWYQSIYAWSGGRQILGYIYLV